MGKLIVMASIYAGAVAAVAILARYTNPRWSNARTAAWCALPLPLLGLLVAIGGFVYIQVGAMTKAGDSILFAMYALILLGIVSLLSAVAGFVAAWVVLAITKPAR